MGIEDNQEQFAEAFLAEKKAKYQAQLKKIINVELTPGNIGTFLGKSLSDLSSLADEASHDYASVKIVPGENQTAIEDEAFKFFQLNAIPELLDTIEEKRKTLDIVNKHIASSLIKVPTVHTPPDLREDPESEGDGEMKPREDCDRLKLVLYILIHDFKLDLAEAILTSGVNTPEMRRKESYITVDVPELNRILEVCDEVGNRTFVYNRKKVFEFSETADSLRAMKKHEKRAWLRQNPGSGISFVEGQHWRDHVAVYLSEEGEPLLVEQKASDDQKIPFKEADIESLSSVARGENDQYRNFWTDEKFGKHWGSLNAIADKLVIDRRALERAIRGIAILPMENRLSDAVGNVISKAYCLEEVAALLVVRELMQHTQEMREKQIAVRKDNPATQDIAGFGRDPDGNHLGSVKRIANKLGIHPQALNRAINEIDESHILKKKKLRSSAGHAISNAYCLEELREHPVVQKLINRAQERRSKPSVARKDNPATQDIAGFWKDREDGRHFGSLNRIAEKLGISRRTLTKIIKRELGLFIGIDMLRDEGGKFISKVYCLEEVAALASVQENQNDF